MILNSKMIWEKILVVRKRGSRGGSVELVGSGMFWTSLRAACFSQ